MPAEKVLHLHLADERLTGGAGDQIAHAGCDLDLGRGLLRDRHDLAEPFSTHLSKGQDYQVDRQPFYLCHELRTRAQDLRSVDAQAQLGWIVIEEPDELVRPPLATRDEAPRNSLPGLPRTVDQRSDAG